MAGAAQQVTIDGHRLKLTNLDKVLYPQAGTTKAEVIQYLVQVAPAMLPHVADRALTRKRYPHGVGVPGTEPELFFEKNLPEHAPKWIRRVEVDHGSQTVTYPVVEHAADLAWLGQMAALELHVHQWRIPGDDGVWRPDRLVLDLDPGPGAGLAECAVVAHEARSLLESVGLETVPVTSGSKGLHLYAPLDGEHDTEYVNAFAKQIAEALTAEMPELVVSSMTKSVRHGKVLVDWSQNNGNKTTITPYSLRGTHHPFVAAPRDWDEIDDELRNLDLDDVLERIDELGDLFAPLLPAATHVDADDVPRSSRPGGPVEVMLASTGSDRIAEDPRTWAYEMKWDGIRAAASVDDGVTLTTRNGNDVTVSYPEVVEALAVLGLGEVVLDGELVAFDDDGAPDFGLLQRRMGVTKPNDVRPLRDQVPVHYLAFDLLERAGESLRSDSYEDRRAALGRLGIGDDEDAVVRVPPAFDGSLDDAVAESLDRGLEGVLAKRRASTYRAERSKSWIKIKHQRTQDVVVVGWQPGTGTRGSIGSLLLAVHRDGELSYVGKVGTGFTQAVLKKLHGQLVDLEVDDAPVDGVPREVARVAHWVEPALVGEVAMSGWTHDGHVRHATWRGLRAEMDTSAVVVESP